MSTFKVGDRVKCTCGGGADCTVQGRVVGIDDDGSARVLCDNGEEVTWPTKHLALIAAATPVAAAPMAIGEVLGVTGGYKPQWQFTVGPEFKRLQDAMARVFAPAPPVPPLEMAAENMAMRAALDTVRRFLGSHSFASCSLACNRELREVMAVVLAALDAERAGK